MATSPFPRFCSRRRRAWGVAGVALAVTSLAACGDSVLAGGSGDSDVIELGAVLSLTGPNAGLGIPEAAGLKFAVEELNAAGGIDGKEVELTIEDDATNPETAAAAADELVNSGHVIALLGGSITASTDAMAARIKGNPVPQIAFTGLGAPEELDFEHLFHVVPSQHLNAQAMLSYAKDELKATKVGILHDSGYGKLVTEELLSLGKEFGITFTANEEGDVAATDVTTQAAKVQATKPDAVFIIATNTVFYRNAKEVGIQAPIVGAIGSSSYEYVEAMGDAADNIVFPEFVVAEDPVERQVEFVQAFEEATGDVPKNFEAAAYDAVMMLAAALERVGTDASAEELGDALTEPYDGLMSSYDFGAEDKTGITLEDYIFSKLDDGTYTRLSYTVGSD